MLVHGHYLALPFFFFFFPAAMRERVLFIYEASPEPGAASMGVFRVNGRLSPPRIHKCHWYMLYVIWQNLIKQYNQWRSEGSGSKISKFSKWKIYFAPSSLTLQRPSPQTLQLLSLRYLVILSCLVVNLFIFYVSFM